MLGTVNIVSYRFHISVEYLSLRRTPKERGRYFEKMDFSLGDVYRSLSDISRYSEGLQVWLIRIQICLPYILYQIIGTIDITYTQTASMPTQYTHMLADKARGTDYL